MRDRYASVFAFFVPFGLVILISRIVLSGTGTNTVGAVLGTAAGVVGLVAARLWSDGPGWPGRPDRWSVLLVLVTGLVVLGAALPVPGGVVLGTVVDREVSCACLGQPVMAEEASPIPGIDTRKYCYGIPHSCQPEPPVPSPRLGDREIREACYQLAEQANQGYCDSYIRTHQYHDAGVASESREYAPPDDYLNDTGDRWIEDQVCADHQDRRAAATRHSAGPVDEDGHGGYAYTVTAMQANCSIRSANMTATVTVDGEQVDCIEEGYLRSWTCPVTH